jgi:large subunit ribosomal protein L4
MVVTENENVIISTRNIPEVITASVGTLNVFDILKYNTVVMDKATVAKVEEVYT